MATVEKRALVTVLTVVFQGCCPAFRAAEALPVPAALLRPLATGRLLQSGEAPHVPPHPPHPRHKHTPNHFL